MALSGGFEEGSNNPGRSPHSLDDDRLSTLRRRLDWLIWQRFWLIPLYVVLEGAATLLVRRHVVAANMAIAGALLVANLAYASVLRRGSARSVERLAYVQPVVDIVASAAAIWSDYEPLDATAYGLFVALITCSFIVRRTRRITTAGLVVVGVLMIADFGRIEPAARWQWGVATAAAGIIALAVGVLSLRRARADEALRAADALLLRTRDASMQRERLAALGELSAVVAHEIRNPVAVIYNSVSALRRRFAADPSSMELLAIVQEESERLDRIVGEMLDLTREQPMHAMPTDIDAALAAALHRAIPDPTACGIRVERDIPASLPTPMLDTDRFHRVLVNLLENARQAMPHGGALSMRVRREDAAPARLRIELSDTGVGMAPAVLERAFEPFFTTRAMGTGLGMSIAKRIIDSMRGTITVTSEVGRGTTIAIEVPIDSPAVPPRIG